MVAWMVHLIRWTQMTRGGGADLSRKDQMAQQALDEKFGRWKWLVGLGPIGLICLAGAAYKAWPGGLTFRLLMGAIVFLGMDLVYTWYIIADYTAREREKEEHNDGKTV